MEPLTIFGALVGATKVTKEVTDVLSRITSATLDAPEAVEKVRLEVDAMQMHLDMLNMHITAKSAANLRTPSQLIIEDFRIVMEGCVRTLDKLRSLVAPMVYPGSGMSPSLIQLLRANWSKTEQARYYINHLHRLQQCLNCVLTILNG